MEWGGRGVGGSSEQPQVVSGTSRREASKLGAGEAGGGLDFEDEDETGSGPMGISGSAKTNDAAKPSTTLRVASKVLSSTEATPCSPSASSKNQVPVSRSRTLYFAMGPLISSPWTKSLGFTLPTRAPSRLQVMRKLGALGKKKGRSCWPS